MPRPKPRRHICPDTCRRGGASGYMNGPWICGACGGYREDMNEPERQAIRAWNERHAVEEVWLQHYGLPSVLKPMKRALPDREAVAFANFQTPHTGENGASS